MSDARTRSIVTGLAAGTVLQLAMVLVGHSAPAVAQLFAVLGMTISLVAGGVDGLASRAVGRSAAARDGAIVGGGCALIGILVSFALGDVPAVVIAFGTLSSAVAGAIGALLARLAPSGARLPHHG